MKFAIGVPTQVHDLAEDLRDENGSFLVQPQGGGNHLAVFSEGHSLKSFRPIGRKIIEAFSPNVGMGTPNELWVTKLADGDLSTGFGTISSGRRETTQR